MKKLGASIAAALAGVAVLFALGVIPPRRAHAAAGGFPAFANSSQTLAAATATLCPLLPTVGRTSFAIYNGDSATVYIGSSNSVNASNGFPVAAGSLQSYDVGYQLQPTTGQLWCYSTAGTSANAIRILEIR